MQILFLTTVYRTPIQKTDKTHSYAHTIFCILQNREFSTEAGETYRGRYENLRILNGRGRAWALEVFASCETLPFLSGFMVECRSRKWANVSILKQTHRSLGTLIKTQTHRPEENAERNKSQELEYNSGNCSGQCLHTWEK